MEEEFIYPVSKDNSTENIIRILEDGKYDRGYIALKNLHSCLTYLDDSEIDLIDKKLQLLNYVIRNSHSLKRSMNPYDVISQEIDRLQIFLNLKRARKGFFTDLVLKHHSVISRGEHLEKKKSLLERLFNL